MAALEQIDGLRKQNKDLLKKLKKQTEKLHKLTLSWPDEEDQSHRSVDKAFNVEIVPRRAPLTERNGARAARASSSFSSQKTVKISGQNIKLLIPINNDGLF